ncbi:MAG: hypothetical protein Q9208_003749 [Pyrenodesmia sp. 3 TL-2023]
MLGSLDRERLQASLRSGKIQQPEFEDAVGQLALRQMTKIMQLHVPDLPTPGPTDAVGYLDTISRFNNTVSAEGSEYNNILQRAEGARGLVDKVYDDWEKLQVIVNAYSSHLHKQWTKRITLRRKSVLEEAWGPGMSPMHRPDFDVIRRGLKGPKYRDALMMPYINLEDLSSKTNLLSLIESRTRMPPEHFAWFDSVSYKTATTLGAVRPAAAYRKVMLLTGQKTRETYGRLSDYDEDDVEDIVWTGFAFQLSHGLVILETQQRLYRFLRRCVELLLHDIDLSQPAIMRAAVDEQQTVSLQDTIIPPKSKEWQSVSEVNIQASYQLPRPFSLASLRKLAGAKRDAAEDAFWTLHQDPGYFRQQLEMRIEQIIQTPSTKLRNAAERFLALMYSAWRYAVKDMYRVLMSSDTFIDFFEIKRAEDGAYVDFHPKQSTKDQWPPIMKLLTELTSTNSNMMGAMNILDEMERVFNSDETQRALINSEVAGEISRLAALAEIHDAFVRHQPTIQSTDDTCSKLIAYLSAIGRGLVT